MQNELINIETKNQITLGQMVKRISSLALPMSISQLITVASGFLCMVMLAKLGHEVLAASALIYSTQLTFIVIGVSFIFSLSFLVGHSYGAREYTAIGNYVQQAWSLGLIISIPIMIIFWYIGPVLEWFGQTKAIAAIVQKFFHAYVWAVVPVILSTCNQQFGYGVQKQKLVISVSLMGVIVLLCTAYVFIFGKFGMPQLGVAGLGYAMAAQSTFYVIVTTAFFYYANFFKKFDLFHYRVHQNWQYLIKMFKVGWPISMQVGGEMLSFFLSAAMVGWLGTKALAAYQVVNQYMFLIVIPLFALSQASGILVGKACGSKQYDEIQHLGYASIIIGLIITTIIAVLFLFMPRELAMMYLNVHQPDNADTVRLIVILFAIVSVAQIFDAIKNILTGALRGMFDTKFPMYIGLILIWIIGLPLGYVMAFTWHWGVAGIAIGSSFSMLIGAVIMYLRWKRLVTAPMCHPRESGDLS